MKTIFKIATAVIVGAQCLAIASCSTSKETIWLENNSVFERKDELIVLTREQLMKKFGNIGGGQFIHISNKQHRVTLQYDDLDGNGQWDEVAFLQSFKPNEKIGVKIRISDKEDDFSGVQRAHARQRRKNADDTFASDIKQDSIPPGQLGADFSVVKLPPFLTEGPAWENDKVGFRIYFDVRNGKDIWGKTTANMVLDSVGVNPANNYHEISDWGMDILKVGNSLGAGSLAMQLNEKGKDTIVRLGGINMGKVVYQKIADGPVRAIIELSYPAWKISDSLPLVQLTEQISIWGGQYFYQSKVTIHDAPANANIIAGIVNLHSKKMEEISDQLAKFIYTYDQQSENKDSLGMSIILPSSAKYKAGQTANSGTEVQNTYYVASPIESDNAFVFRFYAGWQKSDSRFATEKNFRKFLMEQSLLYASPITIQL